MKTAPSQPTALDTLTLLAGFTSVLTMVYFFAASLMA